jgi:hypothetical protein
VSTSIPLPQRSIVSTGYEPCLCTVVSAPWAAHTSNWLVTRLQPKRTSQTQHIVMHLFIESSNERVRTPWDWTYASSAHWWCCVLASSSRSQRLGSADSNKAGGRVRGVSMTWMGSVLLKRSGRWSSWVSCWLSKLVASINEARKGESTTRRAADHTGSS